MTEKLNDLALRLQNIIETAIDGIIIIDDRGKVEDMNSSAASMFLYEKEEVIGHNIKMLMPEPDHSRHDGYLRSYHDTGEPKIIGIGREVHGLKSDGTIFPLRLAVSEVILNDRIIFTGVLHDLTEVSEANERLKRINEDLETKVEERTDQLEKTVNHLLSANKRLAESEEELQSALEKEKELNELKSRFVSMASHEFRTPLSTIMSSASLISKYTTTEQESKRLKHVNRIKSAVTNLTGILNDFLSLSKLEEGKIQTTVEQIDMDELCTLVADELQGMLKSGQTIEHSLNGEQVNFSTDKRILKNILFNVVSNAVKYSNQGDVIKCEINYRGDHLELNVIDQGIGIPMNEQKYLFDRFFRASNVETIQGTGLGLNIVKEYISLLKGSITFKSEPQKGTTFTIKLPHTI